MPEVLNAPTITIKRYGVHLAAEDAPTMSVFEVKMETEDESWRETFVSEEALRAFLRGVEVAWLFASTHRLLIPDVPRENQMEFSLQPSAEH